MFYVTYLLNATVLHCNDPLGVTQIPPMVPINEGHDFLLVVL